MNFIRWIGLGAVALSFCLGTARAEERVRFSFNPPGSEEFFENLRVTLTQDIPGRDRLEQVTESSTLWEFYREEGRFRVIGTAMKLRMLENGRETPNILHPFFLDRSVTYIVSEEGELVDVSGLEAISEAVRENLPADMWRNMEPVMRPSALRQREKMEWDTRFAQFVGETVAEGDVRNLREEVNLGGAGRFEVFTRVLFDDFTSVEEGTRVRIRFFFSTHREKLPWVREELEPGVLYPGIESLAEDELLLLGKGERVVIAESMVIQSENWHRLVVMPVEIPGHGTVRGIRREIRDHAFSSEMEEAP